MRPNTDRRVRAGFLVAGSSQPFCLLPLPGCFSFSAAGSWRFPFHVPELTSRCPRSFARPTPTQKFLPTSPADSLTVGLRCHCLGEPAGCGSSVLRLTAVTAGPRQQTLEHRGPVSAPVGICLLQICLCFSVCKAGVVHPPAPPTGRPPVLPVGFWPGSLISWDLISLIIWCSRKKFSTLG